MNKKELHVAVQSYTFPLTSNLCTKCRWNHI